MNGGNACMWLAQSKRSTSLPTSLLSFPVTLSYAAREPFMLPVFSAGMPSSLMPPRSCTCPLLSQEHCVPLILPPAHFLPGEKKV